MTAARPRKTVWPRWTMAIVALLIGLTAGGWAATSWQHQPENPSTVGVVHTEPSGLALPAVGAWGRIAPQGEVIDLGAPTGMDGVRVEQLLVTEGDSVDTNQVIAVLDTFARRQSALKEAEAAVTVAEAKLEQAKVGAKPAELTAQQAFIARCQIEFDFATREADRSRPLAEQKIITPEELANRELARDRAKQTLHQAEAQLTALKTVRPVDVSLAEQQLLQAKAAVERAEAELEATQIHAPSPGRILKVHARPGQRISEKGVVEMGDVRVMYAIAEIYEADMARVAVGQKVVLRVPSLSAELTGQVERLGWMVGRKKTLNNDPIADTDARVIETWIRINDADAPRVAGLSNARVEVRIEVGEKSESRNPKSEGNSKHE